MSYLFLEDGDLLESIEMTETLNEGFLQKIRELIKGKNNKKEEKNPPKASASEGDIPYKRIEVNSRSAMDRFYKGNDFTLEGVDCDDKSCQMISNFIGKHVDVNTPIQIYVIKGKDMNKAYDLYGDNAYKDNIHIMVIPLNTLKDNRYIVHTKQAINARYFNDVVDNNEYREYLAGRHEKSEQIQWIIDAYARQ